MLFKCYSAKTIHMIICVKSYLNYKISLNREKLIIHWKKVKKKLFSLKIKIKIQLIVKKVRCIKDIITVFKIACR